MVAPPQSALPALHRFRREFFVASGVGLLATLALIFLVPSSIGFALAGPLALLPWFLGCAALSQSKIASTFFLAAAVLALFWPIIVLLT